MGYYAASRCKFLTTFRDKLSVPSSGVKNPWPLKTGCPETSVRNYHYSLCNNPEERSVHPLAGGSLTSRISICVVGTFVKALQKNTIKWGPKNFQFRLSTACRTIENSYGILSAGFDVFQKQFFQCPAQKSQKIVLACYSLQNYLTRKRSGAYVLRRLADVENVETWLENELANSQSELSKNMRIILPLFYGRRKQFLTCFILFNYVISWNRIGRKDNTIIKSTGRYCWIIFVFIFILYCIPRLGRTPQMIQKACPRLTNIHRTSTTFLRIVIPM